MKISVITPTFNAEKYIARNLESVNNQTFSDFEQIVIDGLSSDNTLAIASRFNRVRVYSGPDDGVYDAMNRGIKEAHGDWILFLGADDVLYSPEVLQQVSLCLTDDFDVVYGDVISERFNGRYDGEFDEIKITKKNICHQSIFFNKRVFSTVGLFHTQYRIYADWEHNIRWMYNSKIRKKHINFVIAHYADGGLSSSGAKDDNFFRDLEGILLNARKTSKNTDKKILHRDFAIYYNARGNKANYFFHYLLFTILRIFKK